MSRAITIQQLLGGDEVVVIPDMQRDFCWGSEGKVEPFMRQLVELYEAGSSPMLGLLYAYRFPPESHYVCIIDGQQRITALYLLIGMLYRRTGNRQLLRCLIDDTAADIRPRLQYQTRPQALYFMADFARHFFGNRDGRLSQLERSPWYYDIYDSDPTIRSFIGAIRDIDRVLEQMQPDYEAFGRFVMALEFSLYDCGSRADAERLFITINTTVDPLSALQALKPKVLRLHNFSAEAISIWAEIEDAEERARAIMQMWSADYPEQLCSNPDALAEFYVFFGAYGRAADALGHKYLQQLPVISQLATIHYAQRFTHATDTQIREFHLIVNPRNSAATEADIKRLVKVMPRADVLSLLEVNRLPAPLISAEERARMAFVAAQPNRHKAFTQLRHALEHPLLNGRASEVLSWGQHYIDLIYKHIPTDLDCRGEELDHLRRRLLAMNVPEYPLVRRGQYLLSMCWHAYDWQRLMLTAPHLIRRLIDDIEAGHPIVAPSGCDFAFLINDPKLLGMCHSRILMRPCKPFIGLRLASGKMLWSVERSLLKAGGSDWTPMRAYGSRCIFTDNRAGGYAIDLYYRPDDKEPYRVELFMRDGSQLPFRAPRTMNYDKTRRRLYLCFQSAHAAVKFINEVTND